VHDGGRHFAGLTLDVQPALNNSGTPLKVNVGQIQNLTELVQTVEDIPRLYRCQFVAGNVDGRFVAPGECLYESHR